ncbi:hypothetical protein AB0C29_11505 [Actinoplanes sp. NPDC048791]|uniref:hypothetical protein n=1 Tax=Actinoplanes sp. NPDC048791 TaxID=3154623 RepID=UPI0033DC0E5E
MQQITGREAAAVLRDPRFVVPPVPPGATGIAWLRASVGRFSTGVAHDRRRALAVAVLAAAPPATLPAGGDGHPVTVLARALGITEPVTDLVRAVAQAYQPGTGDESRADAAVDRLVTILGGGYDEPTAALIGVLTQACDATATLIERARHRPVDEVLHDDPPVRVTRRQALVATTVGGVPVQAGEVVLVGLAGGPAFGAGPRRCPGREHALTLVAGALARDSPTVHEGTPDTAPGTGTD